MGVMAIFDVHLCVPYPPHGSAEWLAVRWADPEGKRRVPASDAGVLFGVHPFVSEGELAARMLSPVPPQPVEQTEAMERGHRLEEPLALWWADRHGLSVVKPSVLYVTGRVITSLDFEIVESSVAHVEVKTTSSRFDGSLPPSWWWQGVAQCYATGHTQVEWVILDGRLMLHEFTQVVSAEDVDRFEQQVAFWLTWIDLGVPPEGVELSYADQASRFPGSSVGSDAVVFDVVDVARLRLLLGLQDTIATLDKELDRLKAGFAERLGEAEAARFGDEVLLTWATSTSRRVDTKALAAEHPELVEKFTRTSTSRRFVPKRKAIEGVVL